GDLTADGRLAVDVLPLVARSEADPARARALGAEVAAGDLEDLLVSSGRRYAAVIVSRPHNWTASIEKLCRLVPGVPVVYDDEALFHRRLERQIPFVIDAPTALRVERDATRLAAIEREIAREADCVVAISEDEAAFFRENSPTPRNVVVHPPLFAGVIPTPAQLGARRDVGFVAGWSAGADSPNADALDWFARRILPHVRARVPGTRLLVTGADPPLNVRRLVTPAIEFVGRVTSLADFYASVRVVVVPVRYGSGVKIKTVEAVHFAVPTVATTVGAEGIPFDEPDALVVADTPDGFAAHLATLLVDDAAWECQRRRVLVQSSAWAARPLSSFWPSLVERLVRAAR
ncbi:MAG: glycosyltransferase family 4 protein, partial [Acidimicrobiales bacterium]